MSKKLIKVIFEYEDGTSKYIQTDELERWMGFNHQVSLHAQMRGANPDWDMVKWTHIDPKEPKPEESVPLDNVKSAIS